MIAVNIIVQEFIQTPRCTQIIVRVQAIEDPYNQIIVRVRTCGPSGDRRLWTITSSVANILLLLLTCTRGTIKNQYTENEKKTVTTSSWENMHRKFAVSISISFNTSTLRFSSGEIYTTTSEIKPIISTVKVIYYKAHHLRSKWTKTALM